MTRMETPVPAPDRTPDPRRNADVVTEDGAASQEPACKQTPEKRFTDTAVGGRLASIGSAVAWSLLGWAGFLGLWQLAAMSAPELPGPVEGLRALAELLANPFYNAGANDKGVGIYLSASLQRVFAGFALAALVGIPVGLLIGASRRAWKAINPVVQLLRPVSPLAWFPILLAVFQDAGYASVFTIFVTVLWPALLNTAIGVAAVPEDQRNIARVFTFGRLQYVRHVLIPNALPSIITGLRLSLGLAWVVIVAAEMLSGNSGIGFFVWDTYNAGNLAEVTAAILIIGFIGLVLDIVLLKVSRLVTIKEVQS
jgi:nitrate/nitrite transport system permease protein